MIRLNLALQGGGAHGALTWGALDRLLEETDIEVAAISGTSAGALNAAAFKSGWATGGRGGARAALGDLWEQVGAVTDPRMAQWITPWSDTAHYVTKAIEYSPLYAVFDAAARMMTPAMYGPFIRNPLEKLTSRFDWEAICSSSGPELHICATNVRTGKIRVFTGAELSSKAILASACLPTLFEAIEIYDPKTEREESYWDGGYTGNPALFPLYLPHLPDDILIVNINPLEREEIPLDGPSLQNRINEISFNSSLLREMRAINFVKRLLHGGSVPKGSMKDVNLHMVGDNDLMNELSVASKLIPTPITLARLFEAGREAMDRFLAHHKDDLGKRGTVDLEEMFG
ncbi:patatin-like phospholipase family protein [Marivivens sp. LCG002]|uniref:patatin-like phospholipase family protein n=1 Tax=Marivivens sp. LCG002 TaxID=3051171 RepID=UPI0025564B5A|nr:patatin-like phospholipase family protein [Marivivens sp. LCG002]WIV52094.1 patatin-like phospholipase family protein [Marivivens sp. LCG002]